MFLFKLYLPHSILFRKNTQVGMNTYFILRVKLSIANKHKIAGIHIFESKTISIANKHNYKINYNPCNRPSTRNKIIDSLREIYILVYFTQIFLPYPYGLYIY